MLITNGKKEQVKQSYIYNVYKKKNIEMFDLIAMGKQIKSDQNFFKL